MEKWKSNYLIGQITCFGEMKKRFEMAIVVPVIFNELNLEIRPKLQHFVWRTKSNKRAYIDLYYEDIKLAIEIDEEFHDKRQDEDALRQKEIEEILDCEFFRVDARSETFNVGLSIKAINDKICEKILELKSNNKFKIWEEPETKSLLEVKKLSSKTIIMKTVIENGAEVLPFNRISKEIRENAEQVIAFSGSGDYHGYLIGFSAFNAESYITRSGDQHFVSPTGSTIPNSPYLNTYLNGWSDKRSVVYSDDLLKFIKPKKSKRGKRGRKKKNKTYQQ